MAQPWIADAMKKIVVPVVLLVVGFYVALFVHLVRVGVISFA